MPAAFKDSVNASVVDELASRFAAVDERFDAEEFRRRTTPQLDELELKARMEAIARELWRALGQRDPAASMSCVVDVARAEPAVAGWAAWPLATVVELFGLSCPSDALDAMEHVTKRMSCEFAVRPFLRDHFDATYARLLMFTEHHNDVARAHPVLVVDTLAAWAAEPETDQRMVAHALRTLVKRGDKAALAVLGFATEAHVVVERFAVSPALVAMGDHITLTAEVTSNADAGQRLVVDFVVHHVNASGATSPKVFKWTTIDLGSGERRTLTKRRLIQQATTRTYRAGAHRVELQIAGHVLASTSFDVRL